MNRVFLAETVEKTNLALVGYGLQNLTLEKCLYIYSGRDHDLFLRQDNVYVLELNETGLLVFQLADGTLETLHHTLLEWERYGTVTKGN